MGSGRRQHFLRNERGLIDHQPVTGVDEADGCLGQMAFEVVGHTSGEIGVVIAPQDGYGNVEFLQVGQARLLRSTLESIATPCSVKA